jgi:hypothetical protein
LRERQLVDCSADEDAPFGTPCTSTCGSVYSLLFIPVFIFLSQTSVINLTIAVLIVNLRKLGKKVGKSGKAKITPHLSYDKLERVWITWMASSIRARRFRAVDQRHRMRVLARWLNQVPNTCVRLCVGAWVRVSVCATLCVSVCVCVCVCFYVRVSVCHAPAHTLAPLIPCSSPVLFLKSSLNDMRV